MRAEKRMEKYTEEGAGKQSKDSSCSIKICTADQNQTDVKQCPRKRQCSSWELFGESDIRKGNLI